MKISSITITQKAITLLLAVVTIATLYGCQMTGDLSGRPAIQATALTENEKSLLAAAGVERYFVFDIDLDQIVFEQLEYRVDYYENGILMDPATHGQMGGFMEKGTQRLLWSQINTGNNDEQVWSIAIGGGRMTQKVSLPSELTAWSWSQAERIDTVTMDEPVMLAALVGSSTGSLRGPSILFDESEGGIEALAQYEAAYVLTVTFHE